MIPPQMKPARSTQSKVKSGKPVRGKAAGQARSQKTEEYPPREMIYVYGDAMGYKVNKRK